MKTTILSLIRNSETYVSGQELCEKLGVSRTAVWKVINQLKEEGYEIEALQNKGYRVICCPDVVTCSEIASQMATKWVGRQVYYSAVTESTNADAKRLAEEGAPDGTLAVTQMQKGGRGRRGRGWEFPQGTSIAMSLMLRPKFAPDKASMLTLLMALAVAKGVQQCIGAECGIKWPNDIVLNGRKICGILTEMSTELDYIHHVVIGVGINVNQPEMPEELKGKATSLLIETGRKHRRAPMIAQIMLFFEQYYEIFLETEDLSNLQELYQSFLVNREKEVRILDPKGEYEGIALGINEKGELLVKTEEGKIEQIYAGEVSVRGVNGYV